MCISKASLTVTYFSKLKYVVENSCVNFVMLISGSILDVVLTFMIRAPQPCIVLLITEYVITESPFSFFFFCF